MNLLLSHICLERFYATDAVLLVSLWLRDKGFLLAVVSRKCSFTFSLSQTLTTGEMAEASISIHQEHFSCSICLNLLKEPVTTPCGHSFCMVCINRFWDEQNQKKSYSCPQCRETFAPRPVLRKSNMLTEITDLLKKSDQQTSLINALDIISLESQDVECDSCIGVKEKAVKSCLTCLATYCETHVQPHLESPAFKKHTLIAALSNLQEKMCAEHNKLLEVFCREDKRVICYQCSKENHSDHDTIPVQDEWMEKKVLFLKMSFKGISHVCDCKMLCN